MKSAKSPTSKPRDESNEEIGVVGMLKNVLRKEEKAISLEMFSAYIITCWIKVTPILLVQGNSVSYTYKCPD
jgi:hypothetical protein